MLSILLKDTLFNSIFNGNRNWNNLSLLGMGSNATNFTFIGELVVIASCNNFINNSLRICAL